MVWARLRQAQPESFNFLGFTHICETHPGAAASCFGGSRDAAGCAPSCMSSRRNSDGGGTRRSPEQGRWLRRVVAGLVELPRRTHQHRGPEHLPASRRKPVAARAPAPKPEGLHDVGEDARDHRPLAALATHPPSLASNTFRRQTSKAGAGCLNRARPVLCGGRSVMSVPTAILHFSPSAGSLRRRAAATPRKLSVWPATRFP